MKALVFFLCISAGTAKSFAQEIKAHTIPGTKSTATSNGNWTNKDDSIFLSKFNFLKSRPDTGIDKDLLPYNGMPNAIRRKYPPDIYVGNNGQGQDIYQSQLDNMAVLKPDSSFQSGMPNALGKPALRLNGYAEWQKGPKIQALPRNQYPAPAPKQ